MKIDEELVTELLTQSRTRFSYKKVLEDFLGRPISDEYPHITRGYRLKQRYLNYRDRLDRAYHILRYGYYPGENDW